MEIQWVLIGEIVSSQGNKGEIRVFMQTEFPERFAEMDCVRLFRKDTSASGEIYPVEACRFHKGFAILKLAGIDSIDQALSLKGREIRVARDEVVEPPSGRYYIFDLIDLEVRTTDGKRIGKVSDVLQTAANDVYVVTPDPGITKQKEILIPSIKEVIRKVDLAEKQILIELLDGILE